MNRTAWFPDSASARGDAALLRGDLRADLREGVLQRALEGGRGGADDDDDANRQDRVLGGGHALAVGRDAADGSEQVAEHDVIPSSGYPAATRWSTAPVSVSGRSPMEQTSQLAAEARQRDLASG